MIGWIVICWLKKIVICEELNLQLIQKISLVFLSWYKKIYQIGWAKIIENMIINY